MEVKNFMINKLFMKNKKIWIILTIVALTFLFVGVVSAADYPNTEKINEKQIDKTPVHCKVKVSSVNAYEKQNRKVKIRITTMDNHKLPEKFPIRIKISTTKNHITSYVTRNAKTNYAYNLCTKNLKPGVYYGSVTSLSDDYEFYRDFSIVIKSRTGSSIFVVGPNSKTKNGLNVCHTVGRDGSGTNVWVSSLNDNGSPAKILTKVKYYFLNLNTGKYFSRTGKLWKEPFTVKVKNKYYYLYYNTLSDYQDIPNCLCKFVKVWYKKII